MDETFLKVKPILAQQMKVERCSYKQANEMIDAIVLRKDAYKEVRRKNLAHRLTDESWNDILSGIGCNNFDAETSHSIVVFDDCMGAFKKNGALLKKLFESRHPNITYFLITQDPLGVPSEIKTNIHSLVLFGGLPKQKIRYLAHMVPGITDSTEFWQAYQKLSDHDFIYLDIRNPHCKIEINHRAIKENPDDGDEELEEYDDEIIEEEDSM
jgi:hypothetical protein